MHHLNPPLIEQSRNSPSLGGDALGREKFPNSMEVVGKWLELQHVQASRVWYCLIREKPWFQRCLSTVGSAIYGKNMAKTKRTIRRKFHVWKDFNDVSGEQRTTIHICWPGQGWRSAMHQLYGYTYRNCYSWIWIYWRKVLAIPCYTPNLAMVRRNNMSNVVSWLVWWVAFVPFFSKVFWPREIDWVGRFCVIFFCVCFSVFFHVFFIFNLFWIIF